MAELATIARPYADALFKAQASDLAGTAAWLDELAVIAENAQLQQFVDSPKVSDEQAFDLVSGLLSTALPESADISTWFRTARSPRVRGAGAAAAGATSTVFTAAGRGRPPARSTCVRASVPRRMSSSVVLVLARVSATFAKHPAL